MEKNAVINLTLETLLEILDARAIVNVFLEDQDKPLKLKTGVYRLLADTDRFIESYGNYRVIGLARVLGLTSILIKET